jgi:hypothetical protein
MKLPGSLAEPLPDHTKTTNNRAAVRTVEQDMLAAVLMSNNNCLIATSTPPTSRQLWRLTLRWRAPRSRSDSSMKMPRDFRIARWRRRARRVLGGIGKLQSTLPCRLCASLTGGAHDQNE